MEIELLFFKLVNILSSLTITGSCCRRANSVSAWMLQLVSLIPTGQHVLSRRRAKTFFFSFFSFFPLLLIGSGHTLRLPSPLVQLWNPLLHQNNRLVCLECVQSPFQTCSRLFPPDGHVKWIQRIWETFLLTCQELIADSILEKYVLIGIPTKCVHTCHQKQRFQQ